MSNTQPEEKREDASSTQESVKTVRSSSSPERRQRPDLHALRPSEFMRARHPDLFSDTRIIEKFHLDRAVFDHYLETLTSRKQELAFERFARKLAEKELCPNLVPQTGPTGGGDSKVDTETYPVAEEIAIRWYEGEPKESAQQRWAFAISAKKAWRAKLRADIASASGTGRGYVRVYFITSQYVKDKDRGDTQDELSKQYGFDVHILDRGWILEKIFTNKREQLVFDMLDLERPLALKVMKGPQDARREAELEELEKEIDDGARYRDIEYQLVEDCLQAALLARCLERPRVEVDGRFERAIRIAERYGTRQQQMRVAYHKAWTLYWWYEDCQSFIKAYHTVESLAQGSLQADDTELLKNLWQLLTTAVWTGSLDSAGARLAERTATLKQELQRLERDHTRPTNALRARAQHLLVDLVEARSDENRLKEVLSEFDSIFAQSKGLINFPARDLIDLLMELGEVFPLPGVFDDIFEPALAVAQERDSRATAGRMLLRRGIQKLEHGRRYEAVRLLGRAQQYLALRECRGELVTALALCASAYEAAGLLWAARASILLATSQSLQEFWEEGTFTRQAYACLRRLAWVELQLCRVPCVLAWVEAAALFARTIKLAGEQQEAVRDELMNFDFALGVLLLKTDFFDLKNTSALPQVLGRLNLEFSWIALLYALGYEDRIRAENVLPVDECSEDVLATFSEAIKKTEPGDLSLAPEFLDRRKVELQSSVLGCNITIEAPNENRLLFLAEAILSALEAFLATSLDSTLLPFAAHLRVKITASDFAAMPLEWTIFENQAVVEVRSSNATPVDAAEVHDLLVKLVIAIALQIAVPTDRSSLEALVRDEQALGRAMFLTHNATAVGNILGPSPKLRLADWQSASLEEFALRRKEPWNAGQTPPPGRILRTAPPVFGTGDPPPELLDPETFKHRDRKIISLINIPLWDKAGWRGAGFIGHHESCLPPFLAFIFEDKDAGKNIFAGWQHDIGRHDQTGKLRITIITGLSRKNPAHYRLLVGPNIDWGALAPASHFAMVSRIQTMNPATSENLDRFLSDYRRAGSYYLVPGHVEPGQTLPSIAEHLAILSSQLNVRPAWQIPENDPDVIGIQESDDVIIPDGIKDPPVLRTLERIKKRREYGSEEATFRSPRPKPRRNDPCYCGSGKKFKKCHGK